MTPIIVDLRDYIDGLGGYAEVYVDILMDDSESICVRAEPGTANEMFDLTGTRYGQFRFAIYCKSRNPKTATEQLITYQRALGLTDIQLTDETSIRCEAVTEPHYIQKAENGEVIYSSAYLLEYKQGA